MNKPPRGFSEDAAPDLPEASCDIPAEALESPLVSELDSEVTPDIPAAAEFELDAEPKPAVEPSVLDVGVALLAPVSYVFLESPTPELSLEFPDDSDDDPLDS